MAERDAFLAWVNTELRSAEIALHNGDPGPRRALWSRNEPVSVLGAWHSAFGQEAVSELFVMLGARFSDCTSLEYEVQSWDVVGDMAYTAGYEHVSVCMDGKPSVYTLRATQVYRREDGEWRVAHRHGDALPE